MRIGSPFPEKKARIEIIPLIDIMFFLLASFMLASLSMIRLQSISMNLPSAVAAKGKSEMVTIVVKKTGDMFIDKEEYSTVSLQRYLSNRFREKTNLQVYIKGDKEAKHGRLISLLDLVRQEGIQNVSFAIAPPANTKQ